MTKKQSVWLLAAVLLFAATGFGSYFLSREARSQEAALAESLSGGLEGLLLSEAEAPDGPYVAQVDIRGSIMSEGMGGADSIDLEGTLAYIDSLTEDENNLGMLLYIDSPGGEMGASDTLYYKLMDYKALTGRPIYCYFGSLACSGGYYAAMAADEIWADRNSLCVNIGVYISTMNFSELFDKLGIEQKNFKSSENKGIGMPGTPWTEEQEAIYQSIVDIHYAQFLDVVAQGRGMSPEEVRERNDGREMLAPQALEAGFIDGIGRYDDYVQQVLDCFEAEDIVLYLPAGELSVWDELFNYLETLMPRSDAQVWTELAEKHSGMVVMAHADSY